MNTIKPISYFAGTLEIPYMGKLTLRDMTKGSGTVLSYAEFVYENDSAQGWKIMINTVYTGIRVIFSKTKGYSHHYEIDWRHMAKTLPIDLMKYGAMPSSGSYIVSVDGVEPNRVITAQDIENDPLKVAI